MAHVKIPIPSDPPQKKKNRTVSGVPWKRLLRADHRAKWRQTTLHRGDDLTWKIQVVQCSVNVPFHSWQPLGPLLS